MKRSVGFVLGLFVALALGGIAQAAPESVELKLMVKPQLFESSRATGYDKLWQVVGEEAVKLGLRSEPEDKIDEEAVIVRYYDAVGKPFTEAGYSIRQKFKVKKGKVANTGTLMFKQRRAETELSEAELAAFKTDLPAEAEYKYEADVVGLRDSMPGRTRTSYSASAKVKKQPNVQNMTVAAFSDLYPMLKSSAIDPTARLRQLGDDVLSYEAELGEVKIAHDIDADIETAVWYDKTGRRLQLVELSWKYRPAKEGADKQLALFNALQQRTDVFIAGKLKTEK